MAPKLFLTGTTGYIGGSVLSTLVKTHPEYDITVMLRKPPATFKALYPNVTIIQGDYDSFEVLSNAASQADIVVHSGDSDHEPSINAILAGILRRSTPGFLIHLSGTGLLADFREEVGKRHRGKLNPKIWSDIDDIGEITSRPDDSFHRNVDKIILSAAAQNPEKLKTAIMCPPDIYGKGSGPGRNQSVYFPMYVKEIKRLGAPFYMADGTNSRSWVHIADLMTVYQRLVEEAAKGGGNATWGTEAYYFASSQEASQKDIAAAAAKILKKKGVVESDEPKQVSEDVIAGTLSFVPFPEIGFYMFAGNSRTRADRAKKLLGYEPKAPTLWETLEDDLEDALG